MSKTVSSGYLCEHYDITQRGFQKWVADGCPVLERGKAGTAHKFSTVDVHLWLIERAIKARVKTEGGEHYDRTAEEARLKFHQANISEMNEAIQRGELLPLDTALSEYGELLTNARAKILAFPKLVPAKYREKLKDGITRALNELSEAG